mmetsp:Transcript_35483/g.80580  ORF Transcript_35483/g.80580 Transcript_35483/m.80580 type:complete len:306 (-) Transcript_35483:327-1244(-)
MALQSSSRADTMLMLESCGTAFRIARAHRIAASSEGAEISARLVPLTLGSGSNWIREALVCSLIFLMPSPPLPMMRPTRSMKPTKSFMDIRTDMACSMSLTARRHWPGVPVTTNLPVSLEYSILWTPACSLILRMRLPFGPITWPTSDAGQSTPDSKKKGCKSLGCKASIAVDEAVDDERRMVHIDLTPNDLNVPRIDHAHGGARLCLDRLDCLPFGERTGAPERAHHQLRAGGRARGVRWSLAWIKRQGSWLTCWPSRRSDSSSASFQHVMQFLPAASVTYTNPLYRYRRPPRECSMLPCFLTS